MKDVITIAIAGDSGDGIQLLGQLLSRDMARSGVFIKTEPCYPAEIRAPQGTAAGVSGFKLSFADTEAFAVEDKLDVLVLLNPAGLEAHIGKLRSGGLLLINADQFTDKDYMKAKTSGELLDRFKAEKCLQTLELSITQQTILSLSAFKLPHSQIKQCKNMYVLGLMLYLFERKFEPSRDWLVQRMAKDIDVLEANITALKAGYHYFEVQEFALPKLSQSRQELSSGTYRQLNGNQALALGALTVLHQTGLPMLVAGYPITPASSLLHTLTQYADVGLSVLQAEDEMGACGAALGAVYGGRLGLTCTSGPGLDLKMEMIGLAVMTELPLVVIDIQRAGPSTGMPTKTEQSDLLAAIHGRHGESPLVVLAASTAIDCYEKIIEAFEIALRYSVPVILLSDASIANSIEVWRVPEMNHSERFNFLKEPNFRWSPGESPTLRQIGGLEKEPATGRVSYTALSHQTMSDKRKSKLQYIFDSHLGYEFWGNVKSECLLVTWGGSFSPSYAAYHTLVNLGMQVSILHLTLLNPINPKIESFLKNADRIYVVELNDGQLCQLLRGIFLVNAMSISKMTGEGHHEVDIVNTVMKGALKHVS